MSLTVFDNALQGLQNNGRSSVTGENSAYFPLDFDARYRIPVKMQGKDECMHSLNCAMKDVRILADTGNDTTLITRAEAFRLGFVPENEGGERFDVSGITDVPNPFVKMNLLVQIGDLRPFHTDVGMPLTDGSLAENLLGIDIIKNGSFEITYTATGVVFIQTGSTMSHSGFSKSEIVRTYSACYSCFR